MNFLIKTNILLLLWLGVASSQTNDDLNRFQLAQRFKESADYEKALPIFQQLYEKDHNNYQYFITLNETYIQLKNYFASIDIIEQRLKKFPQDINLLGMLGSSYYLAGNEEQAFKNWDEALVIFPQNTVNYRIIANYAIEQRAFDKAIDIFQKAKSNSDDKTTFALELANLYALTFRFNEAAKEYCEILAVNPVQQSVVETRISTLIDKPGALDAVIQVFEEWDSNRNISFTEILADLYSLKKSYDKALELYQDIDKSLNKQGVELYNFALLLYNEKVFSLAQKVFKLTIDSNTDSPIIPSAKLGYAKSLEAEMEYKFNSDNYWKPLLPIIQLNPETLEKIISAYKEIAELYPDTDISDEAFLQIGRIKFYRQNLVEESSDIFYSVANRSAFSKFSTTAFIELGNVFLYEGKIDSAEFSFTTVLKKTKLSAEDKSIANFKLANVYFYKGDFPNVRDKLSGIISNLKDNSANDAIELSLLLNTSINDSSNLLKFAGAEFLTVQKKFQDALNIYKHLSDNPQAFFLSSISKFRQAEIFVALNDFDSAIIVLDEITEETLNNIYADKALYLKGNIYQFGKKDSVRAIETYEKLLTQFPNSIYNEEARAEIKRLKSKLS